MSQKEPYILPLACKSFLMRIWERAICGSGVSLIELHFPLCTIAIPGEALFHGN